MSATLVLGGARSGKSAYAERLAEAAATQRVYLATAEPGDAEMAARIAAHRARRGVGWRTVEAPLDLREALDACDRPDQTVLIDCATLWLSNLMHAGRDWATEAEALAEALPGLRARILIVSNEVGMGLVPETPLGRAFRDAQGRLNQRLAAVCDQVVFVVAGLPLALKP